MTSGQEDTYSYDLTVLTDYEPQTTQTAPPTVGVGGRLNTPPPPTSMSPGIGVGTTNTSPSILSNVTIGVGGTRALQQQAGRPTTPTGQGYLDDRSTLGYKRPGKGKQPLTKRPTKGAKEPRRTARQNTPSSPSDAGSLRRSSASGSDSGSGGSGSRRGSGGSRRGGSGGGGGGGGGSGGGGGGGGGSGGGGSSGGGDNDDDDDDGTPLGVPGPSNRRARRRILNDQEMEQQLAQILQDQRQMAAGRRIAGITTTNTITTTYKNGRRPTVTRRSTSVRN